MTGVGLSLFDWLLVGHVVGDFLLQTGWMAERKSVDWLPLVLHATVYTACVAAAGLLAGGFPWEAVLFVFLTHLLLDRRGFVGWWGRHVQTLAPPAQVWMPVVTDQAFHVVVLWLSVLLTRGLA